MEIETTPIKDLVVLKPARFSDDRGFFSESYNKERLANAGIDVEFVQDNHSVSVAEGTLRGLHFQTPPFAQAKLVRCGRGALFDVAVDIRQGSPTYGKWFGVDLTFENGKQLYIPAGFLHGFVTREPNTEIIYKCSEVYVPASDGAVRYDDPAIGIDWGLTEAPILSAKDKSAPTLADLNNPFEFAAA